MNIQTPQDRVPETNHTPRGRLRRLRALPGFKVSLVAFLVTVFVGGGTIAAVANWQQSATATIAITAGAAPTTAPPPGTVVVAPALAERPGVMDASQIQCKSVLPQAELAGKTSADILFTWLAAANASAYTVTLSFPGNGYLNTQSVTGTSAMFTLPRKSGDFGNYIVRIQPANGGNAGEAVYRTYGYSLNNSANCFYADPAGRSPLGTFNVTGQPVVRAATTSTMALTWTAASGATSYVVTMKSKTSSYGTEFTTSNLSATLTFPQAARDSAGNPVNKSDTNLPYYGDYSLRIQPMNGATAGDPVSKVIRYQFWSDSIGDN